MDKLIGNRSQQWVLGCYIGTIVYALFLLSTIRDIDSGIRVPALSTYLLITFTIIDIFLFIYFLHYITISVKYDIIIARIFKETKHSIEKKCNQEKPADKQYQSQEGLKIKTTISGIYVGFQKEKLLTLCQKENFIISFIYPAGTFVLKGSPFLTILNIAEISKECEDKIHVLTNIQHGEIIEDTYYYGFRQLKEVAVKALSPGINDPGTAILGLQALADLLAFRSSHFPETNLKDSKGKVRIIVNEKTFDEIFTEYFWPVWDYGKNDRSVQQEMQLILLQLGLLTENKLVNRLLQIVELAITEHKPVISA